MQVGIGRFSSYVVDVDALLSEVGRQRAHQYTQTGRQPCTVRLNPLDLKAVETSFEAAVGRAAPAAARSAPTARRLFGMKVISDERQQLGAITITQCQTSLYHPGRCDCPQTA